MAASSASLRVRMGRPRRASARRRFGVTRSAKGKSLSLRAAAASLARRGSPLFATITGSTTKGRTPKRRTASATASTMAASPKAPVLAA